MLEYGRKPNITSLLGCCARRGTRLRKTETTECFVSTELDQATGASDTVVEVQITSTKTIWYARQDWWTVSHA